MPKPISSYGIEYGPWTKRIILATGNRGLVVGSVGYDGRTPFQMVSDWLEFEAELFGTSNVLVVQGNANGWDRVYRDAARSLGVHERGFSADQYGSPLARNEAMVAFVVELSQKYPSKPACWAHAADWKSGTGHCARTARRAGIPTTDFGVPTKEEDKP